MDARETGNYWETLINEHGSILLLYARQWTNSYADAEEIVQKTFIKLWRSKRFKKDFPRSYLFKTVRSVAIDSIRSRERRKGREKTYEAREIKPAAMFETKLESKERRAAIEAEINKLPREQKEVLVMKIWGDLTFNEIAKTLNVSPNTAASRYRYALAALKRTLNYEQ